MNRLSILESRKHGAVSRKSISMMNESWKKFKEVANDLESQNEPAIYEMNYWVNTREVQTDVEIGENCAKEGELKE